MTPLLGIVCFKLQPLFPLSGKHSGLNMRHSSRREVKYAVIPGSRKIYRLPAGKMLCSTLITVELSVMYVLCMFVCECMTHYFLYVHRGVSGFFFTTPAPLMCADVARACALSETVFHSGENS